MRFLEHKIPPPIVGILSAGMMWVIAHYSFQLNFPPILTNSIAGIFLVMGLLLDSGGLVAFIRQKTTINPLKIERCNLLTTRKKQFYTHTYDPINIIQNIENYTDDTLDPKIKCEYLKNIKERFNLEIKYNCS